MDSIKLTNDSNLFAKRGGTAKYQDQGHFSVFVKYQQPEAPQKVEKTFQSRDDMLLHEQGKRLQGRVHLPISERYRGIEMSLADKVKGTAKRVFYIIAAAFDIKKGLQDYDLTLQGQNKMSAIANYSAKSVSDFDTKIAPSRELKESLNLQSYGLTKLQTSSHWHYNGLPSCDIKNENVTIHSTVTSSNDRNSDKIMMMRRIDDYTTKESIAYTGRPDTHAKAKEQMEFIFRNEMGKKIFNPGAEKGLKKLADGTYELTYLVNNLMTSKSAPLLSRLGITGLFGLDEKESTLMEQEVLGELSKETFEVMVHGKNYTVKPRPIYFNQGFNWLNSFGVSSSQKNINVGGFAKLKGYAQGQDNDLLKKAFNYLEAHHSSDFTLLKPEEELFYRDLIAKLMKLPTVYHCKSSTDRTAIAVAMSTALQNWMNCGLEFPKNKPPHTILSDERFKELFIANAMSCHQVTRVSRSAEGIVKGHKQLPHIIGFEWGKNNYKKNEIVLRLLPERYKKHDLYSIDSDFIKKRGLFKPKKMKYHYTTPDTYPQGYQKDT